MYILVAQFFFFKKTVVLNTVAVTLTVVLSLINQVQTIGPQCVLVAYAWFYSFSGSLFSTVSIWEFDCYKWEGNHCKDKGVTLKLETSVVLVVESLWRPCIPCKFKNILRKFSASDRKEREVRSASNPKLDVLIKKSSCKRDGLVRRGRLKTRSAGLERPI